jgi:hypothetical protein
MRNYKDMKIYKDAQSMGWFAEQNLEGKLLFGWGATRIDAMNRLFAKIKFALE